MFNKRKKYIAIFLLKEQNTYNIIGKQLFNPTVETMEYRNNTYIIKPSTPTYSKGLRLLYFFDIQTKKQLLFEKSKNSEKDTEIIDLIMSKKIIKQLTSELGGLDFKQILLYIVVGLAIGGMLGYIIGSGGV